MTRVILAEVGTQKPAQHVWYEPQDVPFLLHSWYRFRLQLQPSSGHAVEACSYG